MLLKHRHAAQPDLVKKLWEWNQNLTLGNHTPGHDKSHAGFPRYCGHL